MSEVGLRNKETKPVAPGSLLCPCCRSFAVQKIFLLPLSSHDLDQAVQIRKEALLKKESAKGTPTSEAVEFLNVQAESSYLLLSHNQGSATVSSDHDYMRTGRWTDEEITYVDFLVEAFDSGRMTIEHGVKLNDFLSDVLLCKSSRLTKKMKNARLSIRSYGFSSPVPRLDVELLSSLEAKFLDSITSHASRLELKFNLGRLWRSHLSNLCLQTGSSLLDANDWINSLEQLERRAAEADERLRKARRRRMGVALKTDSRSHQSGVFFSGAPVQRPAKRARLEDALPQNVASAQTARPRTFANSSRSVASTDGSDGGFISNMLDLGSHGPDDGFQDEYQDLLGELAGGKISSVPQNLTRKNCGPFLEEIVSYIEGHEVPFQHVDVWVPSYRPTPNEKPQLRLFHAGYATRHDIEPSALFQLDEFGEYSQRFSFEAGVGLPGRVFLTKQPSWARNIDSADTESFDRSGGAKVYGVKTAFAMPLKTTVIGLIVVIFYGMNDLPEDQNLIQKCMTDLAKFSPEPKWKLVIDMKGSKRSSSDASVASVASDGVAIFQHPSDEVEGGNQPKKSAQSMEDEERAIAALLGQHIPMVSLPGAGEPSSSSQTPADLLPHFMSLRLLLLRKREKRTEEENEMVDIIKRSYQGYVNGSRRAQREVALLVARDWQFLYSSVMGNVMGNVNVSGGVSVCSGVSSGGGSHYSHHSKPASVVRIPTQNFNQQQQQPMMGQQQQGSNPGAEPSGFPWAALNGANNNSNNNNNQDSQL